MPHEMVNKEGIKNAVYQPLLVNQLLYNYGLNQATSYEFDTSMLDRSGALYNNYRDSELTRLMAKSDEAFKVLEANIIAETYQNKDGKSVRIEGSIRCPYSL